MKVKEKHPIGILLMLDAVSILVTLVFWKLGGVSIWLSLSQRVATVPPYQNDLGTLINKAESWLPPQKSVLSDTSQDLHFL